MLHTKHIWRAALLLVALLLVVVFARHFAIPESFGEAGFYRYDSLAEFSAPQSRHGDPASCTGCHEEQADDLADGKHATVDCQTCHRPTVEHARGDKKIADLPVDRTHRLCDYCHLKLVARPQGFPQVDDQAHLIDKSVIDPGDEVPARACGVCHDAHTTKESQ